MDKKEQMFIEMNRQEHQESYIFEEWAPIVYTDVKRDLYTVSSLGRVYSFAKGYELSYINADGYRDVALQTTDNERKTYRVHRLVATAFCYNPDPINKIYVNHKNLLRDDNSKYNLEWATPQENIIHAARYYKREDSIPREILSPSAPDNNWGRGELTFGENNGMSIWTEEQVHVICQCLEKGMNHSDCCIAAGIEPTENNRFNVSHIAQGVRWAYISCQYNITARVLVNYDDYIIPVCIALSQGYTVSKEIADIVGLEDEDKTRRFISRIRRRKSYTEISKDYVW